MIRQNNIVSLWILIDKSKQSNGNVDFGMTIFSIYGSDKDFISVLGIKYWQRQSKIHEMNVINEVES